MLASPSARSGGRLVTFRTPARLGSIRCVMFRIDAQRLPTQPERLAYELGRNGRAKALREYEKGVYCTRLEQVYESILSARPIPTTAAG